MHKKLLLQHSRYFSACLGKEWREGKNNTVKMEEDDPEAFEVFNHFVYVGKIFTMKESDLSYDAEKNHSTDHEWDRLMRCWMLGDKLQSTTFKDAITDATTIKKLATRIQLVGVQAQIYENSAGLCGMRKLVVDFAVWEWDQKTISTYLSHTHPAQLLYDLAVALNKARISGIQGSAPFKQANTCYYHDHGDDSPCYKTLF